LFSAGVIASPKLPPILQEFSLSMSIVEIHIECQPHCPAELGIVLISLSLSLLSLINI
jgi:hypothetical protein